eukprot:2427584-Rhodomonas_salina.1
MPVCYSFVVLLLVSCIYAVLATEIFRFKDGEMFGSFLRSLFTMFQISTGDGWASIVARSIRNEDGTQVGVVLLGGERGLGVGVGEGGNGGGG